MEDLLLGIWPTDDRPPTPSRPVPVCQVSVSEASRLPARTVDYSTSTTGALGLRLCDLRPSIAGGGYESSGSGTSYIALSDSAVLGPPHSGNQASSISSPDSLSSFPCQPASVLVDDEQAAEMGEKTESPDGLGYSVKVESSQNAIGPCEASGQLEESLKWSLSASAAAEKSGGVTATYSTVDRAAGLPHSTGLQRHDDRSAESDRRQLNVAADWADSAQATEWKSFVMSQIAEAELEGEGNTEAEYELSSVEALSATTSTSSSFNLVVTMIPCSCDGRKLNTFYRNRKRLPRKQCQHECSSKANRQMVKRNPSSSSGGIDLRISSTNTSSRNGSNLNN
ncbi:unnamed protein product [Protopolystoma xenopodis]|uniref:Uncharacterized protein n=1 Tax=Protopolystoma xenopodis TaxID=117903 RepID=A0A3S5B0U0_9PLAT|nr:unnamed protein product [Protopolystoma xenopodis]